MKLESPREGRWVRRCKVAACCRCFVRRGDRALLAVVGQVFSLLGWYLVGD